MPKTNIQKIVVEYIDKYPKLGNAPLARAIYKDYPHLFKDVEAARNSVKWARGNAGAASKKSASRPSTAAERNPYRLPMSHTTESKTFVLPKACNNILVVGDFHVPYHDIEAVTAAIGYGKKNKVNTIVINGDLIDFHKISRFVHDPRKASVQQEFDAARAILVALRKQFPNAAIYWLKGNHCMRWENWLMSKAPEIFGDPYFELENRLRLNELNIKILDDKTVVRAGKLRIAHGHTIVKGVFPPVNPARGVFLRTKQSTMINHTHKDSQHTETTLDGDTITCFSLGCLCELSPDYNPHCNNYVHGFGHVLVDDNGHFKAKGVRILNGKIL